MTLKLLPNNKLFAPKGSKEEYTSNQNFDFPD